MNFEERMHKLANGSDTAVWAHEKIIEQQARIDELEEIVEWHMRRADFWEERNRQTEEYVDYY